MNTGTWVEVDEDGLPPVSSQYLAIVQSRNDVRIEVVGFRHGFGDRGWWLRTPPSWVHESEGRAVTHWAPLPATPPELSTAVQQMMRDVVPPTLPVDC